MAMATNLKGLSGAKGILLLHGEKISIALVGAVALFIVYKSWSLPKLGDDFQADKLKKEISQTTSAIHDFSWATGIKEFPDKVKVAKPIDVKNDLNVKPDDYVNIDPKGRHPLLVDSPVVPPMIRRTDPVLLNVVDVRAIGGSGIIPFTDEKVRHEQEVRRATEQQAKDREEEARLKRLERTQGQPGGPGQRRGRGGPEGPGGTLANEVYDKAHPKRRPVPGDAARGMGNTVQGGERLEKAYWACVVAKVPIREQLKLYQDALEKSGFSDAQRDFPVYLGFFVERAEDVPGKELQWAPVPLYDGQAQSIAQNKPISSDKNNHAIGTETFNKLVTAAGQFWAGGILPDVVDERFLEYPLSMPLPPVVGREWSSDATHPDIPLAINTPKLEEETQPVQQTPEQTQPGAVTSPFGSATAPGTTGPGIMSPAPGRMSPEGPVGVGRRPTSEFAGPGSIGPGSIGPVRMTPGGGPEGMMGRRSSGSGTVAPQHNTLPKGVDYYLLRFFDFAVEPGKKYRYRVKLVLADPNFGIPANMLASAVLDRQLQEAKANGNQKVPFRMVSKFSDPSPTVGIPLAGNVRLAKVSVPPPERITEEPTVRLMVEAFDIDEGNNPIQAAAEKDYRRGYVANFVEDAEYLGEGGLWIDTQKEFKFLTGMMVLDLDGGAKLTREMTVPSRMLVMGPAGDLYIHHENDDKPLVEYHRLLFEKPVGDKRKGGPGGGPEGPGGTPGRPRGGRTASLPKR
jgi:hypothetical protein